MMKESTEIKVLFELIRAGLWEKECRLLEYLPINFSELKRLAEEQSIVGLVAAGLEHVSDIKVPKQDVLQFIGQTLQLEQRNQAMNYFIGVMVDNMRKEGIYTLLVKGQGIAQCYKRPQWRSCGDVDFFLSDENYEKAKKYLIPLASDVDYEGDYIKHQGMTIDPWVVELHGNFRCGLSSKIDNVLDEIKSDIFFGGDVRSWMNGDTQVFLPGVNVDILYVFTHILNHFYKGGIGLRQICDWCRLLWTYKDEIDYILLKKRLKRMGLMTEWKAFGTFIVEYLGMPSDAMPLYSPEDKWKRKAKRICSFVIEVGNFGHNRDNSYYSKYPYVIRKTISLCRRLSDLSRHTTIFPFDSLRFFPSMMFHGLRSAVKKEG